MPPDQLDRLRAKDAEKSARRRNGWSPELMELSLARLRHHNAEVRAIERLVRTIERSLMAGV